MPHLRLVIDNPGYRPQHGRRDVVEALTEDGWTGSKDGTRFQKNGAVWASATAPDDSRLTCPNGTTIALPSDAPTLVVLAACLAAARHTPDRS